MSYLVGRILESWRERVTGGPKFIDADHAYIHEGAAFEIADVSSVATGIKRFSFDATSTAGSDKYVHFRPAHIAIEKGTVVFEIWEGSTRTSTGTIIAPYNRSRGSSKVSEFTVRKGDLSTAPTSTGDYKKIHAQQVWGGSGPGQTRSGTQTGQPLEWVFKRNTKYVFAVNTTDAYSANFFWYEEGDG